MRSFVALALLCVPLAAPALARDKAPPGLYESYNGFTVAPEPVLPAAETHPSLWFKAGDLAALKARLGADDFMRSRWTAVQKLADLKATYPAPPAATDKIETIHKYYGGLSIAARAHALVSVLTDDPAARDAHRQRAIELLLRAYDGPIFQLDSRVQGSPVDEIYRGSWLQNYGHAYDCLQSTLDRDTDEKIRARLTLEAECVYENLYSWTPDSPHNHLSKPAWGLASIALTLPTHPHAKAWLARALEATNKNTKYFFSADGLYREGSHYLIFSLTNFLPFLYNYRNVSGVDTFPAFQPVFEAMVEERNSRGWLPNIADSYIRPTPTHLAAAAYRSARTCLSSGAPLANILQWSYTTDDLAPFERERSDSGLNYTGASWDYPLEIDELLTWDPTLKSVAPDVAPTQFLAGGQTIFRDSWTNRGDGQRYLLFHGMAAADNHQHDDHLSFIMEAEGQMMCSDSGYSRGTYVGAERTNWYVTSAAHNTMTFGGKAAGDEKANATPPSLFHVDQPGLAAEEKEAFFAKNATWRRTVLWIGGDYYIVADRLNATKPGPIAAYFHGGRGQMNAPGASQPAPGSGDTAAPRTWAYPADRYGRAARLDAWIAAPGATVTQKKGELTYIKGDYAEFPYLQVDANGTDAAWLTVLKPAKADAPANFSVKDLSPVNAAAGAYSAIETHSPTEHSIVLQQPKPGTRVKAGDIETDAALALVRRDPAGKILNYCILDGTTLSVAGRELWHADHPGSIAGK